MATEKEIRTKYRKLHDDLSKDHYSDDNQLSSSKEDFDQKHGKVWDDMTTELLAEGHIKPPEPKRDLEAEIDDLKARLDDIQAVKI